MNVSLLMAFVPTFFFVSITPGMCMTLAMTLGMTIGVKQTLWMILGELLGVAMVSVLSVLSVAALLLNYPSVFMLFKYVGGGYLAFIGVQMWLSKGKMAIKMDDQGNRPAAYFELLSQGFVTAIANPKGWAFFVALLPPFLDPARSLASQLPILISIILTLELMCLLIYALGGSTLKSMLMKSGNVRVMNRIAGSLMIGVGVWLAID